MYTVFDLLKVGIFVKGTNPTWDEITKLRKQIWDMLLDYWISNTLFSFNWWFLLTTMIAIFIVWLWFLDKKRIIEIVTYGLLISSFGFILDIMGVTMVLWSYPERLIPIMTPILEIHKMHMPIFYMLVYQYFHTWKSFLIAITMTAIVFAFVLEPLLVWLGIYEIYHWKYIYSFPIYIILGAVIKWLVIKLKQIENREIS